MLLAPIPSLPRPLLSRLTARLIEHLDGLDGDPELEEDDPSGGNVEDEGERDTGGYAQEKVASVRRLHRTSLPIPHAGGIYPPKPLIAIIGGVLAFESEWNPPLGSPLEKSLEAETGLGRLDLGCVASHGHFFRNPKAGAYSFETERKPATAFLFKLISDLQFSGTVPMIDVDAYGEWLTS